jgi:hypothetical protein
MGWLGFGFERARRRAARDGSLTARATGRHSHILFSLLAVLLLSLPPMPHHSRNSSAITSPSTSNQHTPFLFHFTSFGKTTYRIYPPHIATLSSSIPTNPNQAYPRNSDFPETWFPHGAFSTQIGQFTLHNRSRSKCVVKQSSLGPAQNANLPAFFQSKFSLPPFSRSSLSSLLYIFFAVPQ